MPLPASLFQHRQELQTVQARWAGRVHALQTDLAWERDPALRAGLESQLAEARFEQELIAAQLAGMAGLDDAALAGLPQLADEPAPYRGLLPFGREQARFFFGREAERQRLLERLGQRDFVALIGAAGSGKTSLVQAGLLPDLAADSLSGSSLWQVIQVRPGSRPLERLARQLAALLPAGQRDAVLPDVDQRLRERRDGLLSAVRAYLPGRPLLLIVDPLDDLFGRGRAQRRHAGLAPAFGLGLQVDLQLTVSVKLSARTGQPRTESVALQLLMPRATARAATGPGGRRPDG